MKTLNERMEFQDVKLKVYLENHESSLLIRAKCSLGGVLADKAGKRN